MAGNISKIERIHSTKSVTLWVDLCLNKSSGVFFANVGSERIEAKTKDEAVKRVQAALAKITDVKWRQVIVLRVAKRDADDGYNSGYENNLQVLSADCSFVYMRRERAPNPLVPKQEIERSHPIDFEEEIREGREQAAYFEAGKAEKKRRGDEQEAEMRQSRAMLEHVRARWSPNSDTIDEYELPYSDEAWAGVERIAEALRQTQDRLDALVAGATTEKLAGLAAKPVSLLLTKGTKS